MNTNRLSDSICDALNAQMTKEAHASQIYLAFGSWADSEGYDGISNFLFRHANEERSHMMKVLEYILERGAKVKVDAIPAPPPNPTGIYDCFKKTFAHEVDNTTAIYKIVKMSFDEQDWATWNFMQWFVKEQTEEETMVMNMLDKLKIAGGEKATGESLYSFDRDMKSTPDDADLARDKNAENP
ncbi:MAG: ferritin [Bacteroidota bacterium]|nr:ferritin [Bacteroidota bacterium]